MPVNPKAIVEKALKLGADEAEVYQNTSRDLKIDVLGGKVEALDNVEQGGIGIRVIKNKKLGFAFTAETEEELIDNEIANALSSAEMATADEYNTFPAPSTQSVELDLIDKEMDKLPVSKKIELAMEIESAARAFDARIKKVEKISYNEVVSMTKIANSKGIDVSYIKTVCGASADVIAEDLNTMESGSWMQWQAKYKDINARNIGITAAKRAISMIGATKAKSGHAPVILSPLAASILIASISSALSGESVLKGKSLFRGAIDKPMASKKVSLIDSGILAGEVGSVPFDDEGSSTKENVIISDGHLKSYLHNSYTAMRSKSAPTSNAYRMSFKSQPDITPSNLYIKAGTKPASELIEGVSKGFLIETIMGAHTINTISGDFSIGFSGFLIENGKVSRPVRGMTIAGNIEDVLLKVEEVANDTLFFPLHGNVGSPSLLISSLSVSGI